MHYRNLVEKAPNTIKALKEFPIHIFHSIKTTEKKSPENKDDDVTRLSCIFTASNFGAMMGFDSKSLKSLYYAKEYNTKVQCGSYAQKMMNHGKVYERFAINIFKQKISQLENVLEKDGLLDVYEYINGCKIRSKCDFEWEGLDEQIQFQKINADNEVLTCATPDGVTKDRKMVLEIKCPAQITSQIKLYKSYEESNCMPICHFLQIAYQLLMINGRKGIYMNYYSDDFYFFIVVKNAPFLLNSILRAKQEALLNGYLYPYGNKKQSRKKVEEYIPEYIEAIYIIGSDGDFHRTNFAELKNFANFV